MSCEDIEIWPAKRVGENDYRGADWSRHLDAGETIASYDFLIDDESELNLVTKSTTGTKVVGRFSAGTVGKTERIVVQITTSATPPRTLERAFDMLIV